MFCSQFAAMSMAATLNLLDQELASLKNENGKAIFNQKSIVKSPFHRKENFAAMHPGRLANVIKNYTQPVKPLSLVEKMVNLDTTIKSPLPGLFN